METHLDTVGTVGIYMETHLDTVGIYMASTWRHT